MPPNSRATSFTISRTFCSSVTSQRTASASTSCFASSATSARASLADSRYVIATSAPFSAAAKAIARPSRLAAPVTSIVFPDSARPFEVVPSAISRFYPVFDLYLCPCLALLRPSVTWKSCTETATLPRMTAPREVVVYSRKVCHLCEIVKESLVKREKRGCFNWREVDVDSDAKIRRQYSDEFPVVFINGRKAFKYHMDEQEFLRKLSAYN